MAAPRPDVPADASRPSTAPADPAADNRRHPPVAPPIHTGEFTDPAVDPPSQADAGPSTRPDEPVVVAPPSRPTPPIELTTWPAPRPGQWALFKSTLGSGPTRRKRTVVQLGPGPNDVTVTDQILLDNEPLTPPLRTVLPRIGRRWPAPLSTPARVVRYDREKLTLNGRDLDCIVLTIESRAEGSVDVERQWFCAKVGIDGLVRHAVTTDGREVMREELIDFGQAEPAKPAPDAALDAG